MKVYSAICIEDWSIEDEEGARMECKRGKEYTVTGDRGHGELTVFGAFWVPAPTRIFAGFKTLRGEVIDGVPPHE
jgi:hypothetical protein